MIQWSIRAHISLKEMEWAHTIEKHNSNELKYKNKKNSNFATQKKIKQNLVKKIQKYYNTTLDNNLGKKKFTIIIYVRFIIHLLMIRSHLFLNRP